MAKYKCMIGQFPGGGTTSMHTSPWLLETFGKMLEDPKIGKGNVLVWQIADTPITMGRNRCLVAAEKHDCDFVLMLDNDMFFDLPYKDSVPFWDAAWPFALEHHGPCVIGAPYCGPPPNENVYVFRFENTQSDDPNPNFKLYPYARNEATMMHGIKRCAALPTGLMLIDMRAVKRLPHPRFYYEWTDEAHTDKASTEDVTFSRDLTYAGVPLYCAWDSWAGHIKPKMVGRPQAIPDDNVPGWIVEQAGKIARSDDRLSAWKEKPRGDFLLTPRMYDPVHADERIKALTEAFGECLVSDSVLNK